MLFHLHKQATTTPKEGYVSLIFLWQRERAGVERLYGAEVVDRVALSGQAVSTCAFRRIRSAIPTTSGQSFRSIRSPEDRCRAGMGF